MTTNENELTAHREEDAELEAEIEAAIDGCKRRWVSLRDMMFWVMCDFMCAMTQMRGNTNVRCVISL